MGRRRADDPDLCGVLLLNKPAGPTSHDVVAWVRWALGVRRVGHCGTLDPAATGLLVVGVGFATKLASYLTGLDKAYQARIFLGRSTTTADAQGQTLAEQPCSEAIEAQAADAVRSLKGEHALPPPAYSAVHVDGKRAHELARAGEVVDLPVRPMVVREVEAGTPRRRDDGVEIDARLLVSKGTYIRSLAEEVGRRLEIPAHLSALHRTQSGALSLEHPSALDELAAVPGPPGKDGHERFRVVGPGGAEATRESVSAWLRAHLVDPAQIVPMPLVRVSADESGSRAFVRLASGQPVPLADPGFFAAPEISAGTAHVAVAAAEPTTPGLLVTRPEGEGALTRLQPERTIVPPFKHP